MLSTEERIDQLENDVQVLAGNIGELTALVRELVSSQRSTTPVVADASGMSINRDLARGG